MLITNRPDLVLQSECVTPSLFSDHRAVLMKPRFRLPPIRRLVQFTDYNFQGFRDLNRSMETQDFAELFSMPDVHKASEWLENIVSHIVSNSFPVRKVLMSDRDPQWMTPKTKWLLTKKKKALRRHDTATAATIDHQITSFKVRALSHNPRHFWNDVNKATHRKTMNNEISHTSFDCHRLNEDLADRSRDPHKNFTNETRPIVTGATAAVETTPELSLTEVANCLESCKKTTPGPSGIPFFIFKDFFDILAPLYCHIWNWSLRDGVFPENYKKADLIPIPKVKRAITVDQIRGISVTSIASRLFEKMVHRKLILPHIVRLGDPLQFAYKPRLSTSDCLLTLQFFVLSLLDRKEIDGVHLVLLDFSKAFDRMDQQEAAILFPRFISSHRLCQWLYDFMSNRYQRLIWKNEDLPFLPINLGCSQGTVGGPNIFSMFTDDIRATGTSSKIVKYSDDTNIIIPCYLNPNEENKKDLQQQLNNIEEITTRKKLTINNSKSHTIRFCLNYHPSCSCLYNTSKYKEVPNANILGIVFQNNCLFSNHVISLIAKLKRSLYVIRDLKLANTRGCDIDTVFNALIISRIRYGISVYGSDPQTISKLDAFLQKCHEKRYCSQKYSASDILKSEDQRTLRNILSNPCHPLIQFLEANPKSRSTRHNFKHVKPFTKTKTFLNTFINRIRPF